jgi:hypothetical protein
MKDSAQPVIQVSDTGDIGSHRSENEKGFHKKINLKNNPENVQVGREQY